MTKEPRLPFIAALYVSQYLGIGFLYYGVNSILRDAGIELNKLGIVQLLGLIWVAKALWAPLVDQFTLFGAGRYRSWLLITQPLAALSLLALIPFNDVAGNLNTIIAFMAIFVIVSATQDIACDALVTRYVRPTNQGLAQSTATAGQWVGNLIGGGLVLITYDHFGWEAAIIVLATMVLAPLPFIFLYNEPPTVASATTTRQRYTSLLGVFALPGRRQWMMRSIPLYWGANTALYALLTAALVDHNWQLSHIGILLGMGTAVPGILGAVFIGGLLRKVSPGAGIGIAGVIAAIGALTLLPLMLGIGGPTMAIVGVCCYVAGMSAVSTTVYRAHVLMARPEQEGTDFTTLASAGTLWTTFFGFLVFQVSYYAGYAGAVGIMVVLGVVGTYVASRHFTRFSYTDPLTSIPSDAGLADPVSALPTTEGAPHA